MIQLSIHIYMPPYLRRQHQLTGTSNRVLMGGPIVTGVEQHAKNELLFDFRNNYKFHASETISFVLESLDVIPET